MHTPQQRHQILRAIFEPSPAFMVVRTGPDHVYTYCNPAYRHLIGGRDVVGRPAREVMAEISDPAYTDLLDRVYATGAPFQDTVCVCVRRHPGGPGEERFLKIIHLPIRDEQGQVVEILSHGIDITDAVRSRQALQQSEHKFRSLVEQSLIGIVIVQDNRFVYVNPRMAEMVGYAAEALLRLDAVTEVVYEADRPLVAGHIARRLAGQQVECRYQARLRHHSGRLLHVEIHGTRFTYQDRPAILTSVRDVTEQVAAEAALRESEARYSSIFHNNHAVMLVIDPATAEIVDANPAACRYYGYPHAELTRLRISDINALSADEVFLEMQRARDEERNHFHFRHRLASGEIRHVEVSSGPITVQGRPLLYSIIHDTTERYRAEAKLTHQEQLFRLLAEHAQDLVFLYTFVPEPGFAYVSPAATRITGYTPEEHYADPLLARKLLHPEDLELVERFQANPTQTTLHLRGYRKDGALIWMEQQLTPIRAEDGRLLALEGLVRDVTARVAAEATRKLQAAALEAAASGIMITRADGTIVWANEALSRLTGYTLAELQGQAPPLCQSGEQEAAFYAALHHTIQTGAVWRGELTNRRKDGTRYVEEMTITPVRSTGGAIDHCVAVQEDITARKEEAQALVEAKEHAEQMVRLKNAFLANMSHEIRTPLTSIIGFADLLADVVQGEGRAFAEIIRASGERLLATLNSVLDLAQLESGSMHLRAVPVDVQATAREVIALFAAQAAAKGVALHLNAPATPIRALLDPAALARILMNLISNAVKFTPSGHVVVRLALDADALVLEVRDTGIGIAPAFLPHLFEEFRQASEGPTRRYEGNGLGLAITQRLVDLMGGTIHADSPGQQGSTFVVRLPHPERPASPVP